MKFDLVRLLSSDSFTSFWYWAILVVMWSRVTHFSLGVGLHDIRDASKNGGQDMQDVEDLIDINSRKLVQTIDNYGVILFFVGTFFIATIATLGFRFEYELMQASALLLIGSVLAFLLTIRFAYVQQHGERRGDALCKAFMRLRMFKQFVGIATIFIISFYSAYYVYAIRGI